MAIKNEKNIPFVKIPTGIDGLDEILEGGFPQGRTVLICGGAGCGKSLMGIQFLAKGILDHNEPGVMMSFEETTTDVIQNAKSIGTDIEKLISDKKLKIDHVRIERSEIEETGEYDLEGLFVRLNYAIDSIGAKRVVLDTIEALFGGIDNETILRNEIRRLFQWLKKKGVTTIITGERGENSLTRQGLEEYVSDCVILLDFRVADQIATRRLRVIKYRGSPHGTNEYPFLIDNHGISVLPITSLRLDYKAATEIISTGLPALDSQFKNGGIYRGNSVLITGTAGTAKTILASYFAMASCKRNEKTLFYSFEESPEQLVRNMESIGIRFRPYIKSGLLILNASRPSLHGLEMHLLGLNKYLKEFQPQTVIIDPISSLVNAGTSSEVKSMLIRLLDILKAKGITSVFTSLRRKETIEKDATEEAVSSLADTWIALRNQEFDHNITRGMVIVKARGMGHSGNPMDFIISDKGVKFVDRHNGAKQSPITSSKGPKKHRLDGAKKQSTRSKV